MKEYFKRGVKAKRMMKLILRITKSYSFEFKWKRN